jgi:ribosomal protein S18 acetylase RimI-like enzyme
MARRVTPEKNTPGSLEQLNKPVKQTELTETRVLPELNVRAIRPEEINHSLSLLFDEKKLDRQALRDQIRSFQKLARQENYDLSRQMVLAQANVIRAACSFVPCPGHTAFVFVSAPEEKEFEIQLLWKQATQMLSELAEWAFKEGSQLLQVLIDPQDKVRSRLCSDSGFQHLTDLVYLYGDCTKSLEAPSETMNQRWETYTEQAHNRFKYVISRTYEDSLDCPELENLRTMDDVILGHKAAGDFNQQLWKILYQEDQPAGVLLLSPLKNRKMTELTYMGLVPEFRKRGLAKVLLAEAVRLTRRHSLDGLTLAVDKRNQPAMNIYSQFGLEELFQRTVFIRTA